MAESPLFEITRLVLTLAILGAEYYMMNGQDAQVMAHLWRILLIACQRIAYTFGRMALKAEYNYYVTVGA